MNIMTTKQQPSYLFPLIIVFIVCFLIGFISTMNNSMIEFCKEAFKLSDTQGQLINTFFYGAYFFSIPLAMMMSRIGYKATLVMGLMIVGTGFIANNVAIRAFIGSDSVYTVFLCCMSIVALGVVMLQLVANPYVMVLGKPETGAFRMTLSQALNSVATTVAPIFITAVIIAGKPKLPENVPAPFLFLGILAIGIALVLAFIKLPDPDRDKEQGSEAAAPDRHYKSSVFHYPHVWFGAVAIAMYMALEVGIPSMLPAYWKTDPSLPGSATHFLPFYWGGMMVGRFIGSAMLAKVKPRMLLNVCVGMGAMCVALSFIMPGIYAVYAMLATGLFHSVMWPLVFNLGLQHLGPHTKNASGIISMGVLGAATMPLVMGMVVDHPAHGVEVAIMMTFIYYAYVMWFCNWGSRIGIKK
jgi:FHS family L-fucose permease-like MFS transporter